MAALLVLGLVIFISPPAARLWIAALVLVMAFAARGKAGQDVIDSLRRKVYGS